MSAIALALTVAGCRSGARPLVVGSKNFTESVILGELIAQQLEGAGIPVQRKLNLGGTFVCHQAVVAGQIDLYPEYTGTAYAAILKLPVTNDSAAIRQSLDSIYAARWQLAWLKPFGFNNTFAMLVRGDDARRLGIATLSEAAKYAPRWTPGFGYEFMERADGFKGLVDTYGLTFGSPPSVMDLGLTYRALADKKVDIIAGNSTDGQIEALHLVQLRDDKAYFPRYDAVPVMRTDVLNRYPAAKAALDRLGGAIDEATMRHLNYLVDVEHQDPAAVAKAFLSRPS